MYKEDLALNNLQLLICHETQPNHTHTHIYIYMCVCVVGLGFMAYQQL